MFCVALSPYIIGKDKQEGEGQLGTGGVGEEDVGLGLGKTGKVPTIFSTNHYTILVHYIHTKKSPSQTRQGLHGQLSTKPQVEQF